RRRERGRRGRSRPCLRPCLGAGPPAGGRGVRGGPVAPQGRPTTGGGPGVRPAGGDAPGGPPAITPGGGGDLPPDGDGLGGTPTSRGGPEAGPQECRGQGTPPASSLKTYGQVRSRRQDGRTRARHRH